jgi:hypothetical protein
MPSATPTSVPVTRPASAAVARGCSCTDRPASISPLLAVPSTPAACRTRRQAACYGAGTNICGAPDRLTVYRVTSIANNEATVGSFRFLECGIDSVSSRVLKGAYQSADGRLTAELCASACAAYTYFGLEFGKECFCGNDYTGSPASPADCTVRCDGNSAQLCGGRDRISVYTVGGAPPA